MTAHPKKPLLTANLAEQLSTDVPAPAPMPSISIHIAEGGTLNLVVGGAVPPPKARD